jgi:2-hydroxychromene-2-carboxylate isomerase
MAEIEYFYSTHSSYAYLGSARFQAIARAAGRTIVHRPVELDEVLPGVGSTGFRERSEHYREYFFTREVQRWSEYRGVPVKGRPPNHHHDVTLSNSMVVAGALDGQDMDALSHALLQAHWRYHADLADRATLARVAGESGYDAEALLTAAATPAVREAYAANTREAIERHVFGSPTFFVDGDMFYGQDRLELVERALEKPFARTWSGE